MRQSNPCFVIGFVLAALLVMGVASVGAECVEPAGTTAQAVDFEMVMDEATGVIFGADAETIITAGFQDTRCVPMAPCNSDSDCGSGIWKGRCLVGPQICLCW